eukprot:3809485-Rhodomonas_salina.2
MCIRDRPQTRRVVHRNLVAPKAHVRTYCTCRHAQSHSWHPLIHGGSAVLLVVSVCRPSRAIQSGLTEGCSFQVLVLVTYQAFADVQTPRHPKDHLSAHDL